MRLSKVRIQGYRSIKDTGYFDIETMKTILVGPNEAGKTAILQALQKLNPPEKNQSFDSLRDYPRSSYDKDIVHGNIDPSQYTVVEGYFNLEDKDKINMPDGFDDIIYVYGKKLDNSDWHRIIGGASISEYRDIEKDLIRLSGHIDEFYRKKQAITDNTPLTTLPSQILKTILGQIDSSTKLEMELAKKILEWLDENLKYIDESNNTEENRFDKIKNKIQIVFRHDEALKICKELLPKFILFSNYFRLRPSIHLQKLAERTENNTLDDEQYDYGNNCLLKYLGFSARQLSIEGDISQFNLNDKNQYEAYRAQLDKRNYTINAATIRLTEAIVEVWNPKNDKRDANKLRIVVDGQYMKVVVEDELGVEVEIDQRSEGFQWLVSFFIVFFAEAADKHKNAILLLDEPGMSLHALKQVEFQQTITKLSQKNQTIFSTHSPFLVGVDELDKVRVVEMTDRRIGTKVNTSVTATDSGALLPLQEALGYDLAQSLFFHKKNLVLEGLTDYWYLEVLSKLAQEAGKSGLDDNIALLPANCASKVVYYATILHAQNLKVAALLDSDAAGDLAAKQDTLVNALGNKKILRTKDVYVGAVVKPEIEDLLRNTILNIAKEKLGWDAVQKSNQQTGRPIVEVLSEIAGKEFSKYKLAKTFLKWAGEHDFSELTTEEQSCALKLLNQVNKALK